MTELEKKIKSKIPGPDTGIEVRRSLCAICSPGHHCGVDCYVKDGEIIRVEGTQDHPYNHGKLCTKGSSLRNYVYRADRIRTPLRRVGERGEGKFEPITWDEAYDEISRRLLDIRQQDGADAVAFFGGYNKWYRPWLRRFAHSFGTYNYGTESSTCMTSGWMAWKVAAGQLARPDMAHCDLYLGFAFNPYYSGYLNAQAAEKAKANGTKFIVVDPRVTPTVEKLADLHLRPWPGTDGALALCMANTLIQKGWIDRDYIARYVHGFEAYAEYVRGFHAGNIQSLTGVPYEQVLRACEMIHESRSMAIHENSAPIPHHKNGLQNYRAIMSLSAITGNFDRTGGQLLTPHSYMHVSCGFPTREEEFLYETRPTGVKPPVGAPRFPLWDHLEGEMQAMDLSRQILEGTPYPLRAVFALGMNARMFPDSGRMFRALEELDFFVDTDLFLTDTARYADIVLPACSSFERGEFKPYPGGVAWYTSPAIQPLGQSKSDVDIIAELARYMDLPDEPLKAGYEAFVQHYILDDYGVTTEQLKQAELPIPIAPVHQHRDLEALEHGLATPTGKYELKSAIIEAHPQWGLDALPTYREPLDGADPEAYPFVLTSGSRIPNAIHSRLHAVPANRSLRPHPTADLNRADCARLGVEEGDRITISTPRGRLTVQVHPTLTVPEGLVNLFHGYSEADANSLLDADHLDPYSGFPAYRSTRCAVTKEN